MLCSPQVGDQLEQLGARISRLEAEMHVRLELDSVGAPDYAQWSAGAEIIASLTSPTYNSPQPWRRGSLLSARPVLQSKPPELAISPEVHLGYCWAMAGSTGTLGVSLAKTIVPRAVTIDHVAKPLLFRHTDRKSVV